MSLQSVLPQLTHKGIRRIKGSAINKIAPSPTVFCDVSTVQASFAIPCNVEGRSQRAGSFPGYPGLLIRAKDTRKDRNVEDGDGESMFKEILHFHSGT